MKKYTKVNSVHDLPYRGRVRLTIRDSVTLEGDIDHFTIDSSLVKISVRTGPDSVFTIHAPAKDIETDLVTEVDTVADRWEKAPKWTVLESGWFAYIKVSDSAYILKDQHGVIYQTGVVKGTGSADLPTYAWTFPKEES